MIHLSYPQPGPGGEKWEMSKPAYASEPPPAAPRPSSACLYVASLMTEDAWRVVGMLERANEACEREYAAYGFEAADRQRLREQQPRTDADAAKAKIWSIDDIVGKGAKKRSASPEVEPERGAKKFRAYGPAEGAPPGYGHSSATGSSSQSQNQQRLDARLTPKDVVEPPKDVVEPPETPLSQLMLQEMVGDYCCRYVEQLYRNGTYMYQCVYCHQRFPSAPQVCKHQTHVHPFTK